VTVERPTAVAFAAFGFFVLVLGFALVAWLAATA
jgi:hypothetical protein